MIESSYFNSILTGLLNDKDSLAMILDLDGNLLFDTGQGMTQEDADEILRKQTESGQVRLGAEEYSLVTRTSNVNGWRYLVLIPNTRIVKAIISENTFQFFSILAILLVCVILGILLALHYYTPIHKIDEILLGKEVGINAGAKQNQVEQIQMHVSQIVHANKSIAHELDERKDAMRQNALIQVLDGTYAFSGDKIAEIQQLGVRLPGPYYQVVTLRPDATVSVAQQDKAYHLLKDAGYNVVATLYKNVLAIIISTGGPDNPQQTEARRVLSLVRENGMHYSKLGISQAYADFLLMNVGFIEAIAALESDDESEIVSFETAYELNADKVVWYPGKAQIRLAEALSQGNAKAVDTALQEVETHLRELQQKVDYRQFRFFIYSIIHDLIPVLDKFQNPYLHWEINRLLHYSGTDDFLEQLKSFCQNMAAQMRNLKMKKQNQLLQDIHQYIDMHYQEQGICLSAIAERFALTNSTLSRLFSEGFDMRFIDYLSDKRLEKATQLLSGTDLNIKDIVTQIGYIDLSSFTRKFTQKYGVSPGQYRKAKGGHPTQGA